MGTSWSFLEANKTTCNKKSDFKTEKGVHLKNFWPPIWEPKSVKIATRNESKFKTIFKSEKLLFKSLLEPSWAEFGAFRRPSWGGTKPWDIGKRDVS